MGQLDKQKEWVGFWKIAFFFFLGSEFTLIGFIFNNFDKLTEVKLVLITMGLLILSFGVIISAVYLKKEINKLEGIDE